jgi:hypothetical protein
MPSSGQMTQRAASGPAWWLALAGVSAVLIAPLFLTEMPPLLDYPNHLARMAILAADGQDPALAQIYAIHWRIVPNIGIDLAMPRLMRILPLFAAGKIFVALALLLPLVGVAALHRAVFRVRDYWPLAAALVAYNRLFFAGFLNFLIGVGLALLGAAIWEFQRNGGAWRRLATASIAALIIFFCHLIAVAFYGLLLLALELGDAWRRRRLRLGPVAMLAVPFVLPAILYLRAPISGGAPAGGHGLLDVVRHYYWALAAEPRGLEFYGLLGPFLTYDRLLDAAAMVLVLAALGVTAFGRRLKVAPALAGTFVLLLLLYPVTPFFLMETAWVDQRLPVLAGFVLFAGALPRVLSLRTKRLMVAAFAVPIVARTAVIASVWAGHDRVIADFRQVIAPVGPGDRVLVVQPERNADPRAMVNNPDSVRAMRDNDSTMHLPALLVIERKAFWPLLFTAPTKQPVAVNPPYDAISLPEGELPWVGGLAAPGPEDVRWAPYLPDWEHKFDWVLVLHPGAAPSGYDLLPDRLEKAGGGGVAALYRVRR